ncbi:hypothetical protein SCHPADRAFT_612360 [Schizopora paradoxa]|uniref:Uncharacterized protein n=1 Tax=Schizopora paradoxa TaxID=27342 RepID=A0A0H2RFL8_9AGAM|nr:hypothetical protein SCHPADRAFT_612360 [Schizopora paradoxa]
MITMDFLNNVTLSAIQTNVGRRCHIQITHRYALQPFSLARGIALFYEPFGASRTRSEQSGLKPFRDRRPETERSARIRSLGEGCSRVPSRRILRKEGCRASRHLFAPFYGVHWLCQTVHGPFDPGAGNFAFPRASEKGCKHRTAID